MTTAELLQDIKKAIDQVHEHGGTVKIVSVNNLYEDDFMEFNPAFAERKIYGEILSFEYMIPQFIVRGDEWSVRQEMM